MTIRMDGQGRALENTFVERLWRNVKYEDVYLRDYATTAELLVGLTCYFAFYNGERPRQALANRTPREVYVAGTGGGASNPDHWKKIEPDSPATAQHGSAATAAEATAKTRSKLSVLTNRPNLDYTRRRSVYSMHDYLIVWTSVQTNSHRVIDISLSGGFSYER